MGIFSEDLVNFGNLLDAEIEIKLNPTDLKKVFQNVDFAVEDGILKLFKKKRSLIFTKAKELRLKEDSRNVYNKKEEGIRSVRAIILTRSTLEEFKNILHIDEDFACINLWEVIKQTELYEKIPKHFKDKIVISRYAFKKDYIQLYLKVEK